MGCIVGHHPAQFPGFRAIDVQQLPPFLDKRDENAARGFATYVNVRLTLMLFLNCLSG